MQDATGPFADPGLLPWSHLDVPRHGAFCNLCGGHNGEFDGVMHSEGANCRSCGSIARERFLHWTWQHHWDVAEWAEVVETSPRLGRDYRRFMARRLRYRGSDYDQRGHNADIRLDLQALDLEEDSLDVMLSTHVLEHVPDTMAALREIRRVLAPGGLLVLQVPLVEPETCPPATPEFHGDDTPVFWRFGFDLADRLSDVGFEVTTNVTQATADAVAVGAWDGPVTNEFDVAAVIASGKGRALHVVADPDQTRGLGFGAGYMLVTWVGRVPGTPIRRPAPTTTELRRRSTIYPALDGAGHLHAEEQTWGEAAAPLLSKTRASLRSIRDSMTERIGNR